MMGMDLNKANRRRTGSLGVKRIACVAVLIGVLWGALPPAAGGDIYWFQDELGVVHMSNVPVDARFLFKEKEKRQKETKILSGKRKTGYDKLIDRVARAEGLDADLLRAVVETESNFDPNAVSKKGAVGLMQLMPETAKGMGVSDPYHPAKNLEGGARHLRRLIDKYEGKLTLALSAYNAGEKAVELYKGIPPFPETQDYVRKVLKAYDRAAKERHQPVAGKGAH
jgi:soluble lytic murein transglycosylase-like protein